MRFNIPFKSNALGAKFPALSLPQRGERYSIFSPIRKGRKIFSPIYAAF